MARYLKGDTSPVFATIATAQAVAVCDLVALVSNTIIRAEDFTWGTAVATPAAPTVAASAATRGTALTNALTGVKVSAQFPWGEGALSAAATATPTAAFGLKVTLAALPLNATAWNVYVEDAAGSANYLLQQVTAISAGIVYVDSYGTGRAPPSAVLTDATTVTQYGFALALAGVSGQAKPSTTLARIFGNSTDNIVRVNTAGVYEYTCTSATYQIGDYVGPIKATGNTLVSQTVAAVVHESLAIGRVEAPTGASATLLTVKLLSKFQNAARQGV